MFSNQMLLDRLPGVAKILSSWTQDAFTTHSIYVSYELSSLMVEWLESEKCGSPNGIN